eukprot:scaffold589328_cov46-Prasinocladus_malaysianus.AAC.3
MAAQGWMALARAWWTLPPWPLDTSGWSSARQGSPVCPFKSRRSSALDEISSRQMIRRPNKFASYPHVVKDHTTCSRQLSVCFVVLMEQQWINMWEARCCCCDISAVCMQQAIST